jgi:radical SAM protein with 4Fe4S-binding SPASM domain
VIGRHFSLILLPTNECNVACDYCFEDKTRDFMSLAQLEVVIGKLLDHMERKSIGALTIYWQGGEVMLLPPDWFARAHAVVTEAAMRRGTRVRHHLQSNMIGYTPAWNGLIAEMFDNCVGTSMDFPNLYRRARGRPPDHYTAVWTRNIRAAREAGIHVGVIAIPNAATVELGARRFYEYFVDELGIDDFQVNTAFSGGAPTAAKRELLLDVDGLARFFVELVDIWVERGRDRGIALGPFDELMNHFRDRAARLPCIWQRNCADEFVSIDARGQVAQCDCWVMSYPEYAFGNVFGPQSFTELLETSPARRQFSARPQQLIRDDTCLACDYLAICHGGCPVRAYAITGKFFARDPYCEVYKAMFSRVEAYAAPGRVRRRLPLSRSMLSI